MSDREKRLNSTEIARLAGVSRSTVSRVINGYSNVPAQTHKRVMDVIKEYGYYPSFSGQVLAGKRTNCLGLFWVSRGGIANDTLASSFMVHVIEAASQVGYIVMTCIIPNLQEAKHVERVRSIFHQGRIDGGIFIGMNNVEPVIEDLISEGMMVGFFDHFRPDKSEDNRFMINFEPDTGERMIDYVYSMGHRNIGIIDGDLNKFSSFERHDGFMRGMLKYGLEIRNAWVRYGNVMDSVTQSGGFNACREMLKHAGDMPTVICCNNDAAALGAYDALAEAGMIVGRDISVVGIDGNLAGVTSSPPLTTYNFSFRQMFYSLVSRMVRAIEGEKDVPRLEVARSVFVERQSVVRL